MYGREAPTKLKKIIGNYKVPILPLSEDTLVVDCGVGCGYFFWFYHSFFNNYIGIEASKENVESLQKKIEMTKFYNYKVLNYACYSEDNKYLELKSIRGNDVLSKGFTANNNSLFYEVGEKQSNWNNPITENDLVKEKVETISLEGIFSKLNLQKIDFLKVDIEKAEYDFLMGKDLSKVRFLSVEAPEKFKKSRELLSFIKNNGFVQIFGNGKDFTFANKNENPNSIFYVDFPTLYFSKLKNNFPFSSIDNESYLKKSSKELNFIKRFLRRFKQNSKP